MRTLPLLAVAALLGCGGGRDADPEPWSGVTIESPTAAASFTTDQPTVDLAGRSFVPAGSVCDGVVGTIAAGYQLRWRNAANGRAGTADALQLNCLLAVSLTWQATAIPLEPGDNPITVSASAADGTQGRATLQVRRVTAAAPAR